MNAYEPDYHKANLNTHMLLPDNLSTWITSISFCLGLYLIIYVPLSVNCHLLRNITIVKILLIVNGFMSFANNNLKQKVTVKTYIVLMTKVYG